MAITASGMYVATFVAALGTTQLALDLDLETHKVAFFTDTVTPNFTTDTAYGVAPYAANEVTGTNWPAGGVAITGTTVTASAGTLVWDAADLVVASVTLTAFRGGLIYADALAGNNAILLQNYGTDQTCGGGTLTVQWAAGGIAILDLTP